MCLLGSMGGGATSSRQVMAVLSSQGRGDGGTLPSLVNNGTESDKTVADRLAPQTLLRK